MFQCLSLHPSLSLSWNVVFGCFISWKKKAKHIQANALVTNISTILFCNFISIEADDFWWANELNRWTAVQCKMCSRCLVHDGPQTWVIQGYFPRKSCILNSVWRIPYFQKLKIKNQHHSSVKLAAVVVVDDVLFDKFRYKHFLNERISGIYLRRSAFWFLYRVH